MKKNLKIFYLFYDFPHIMPIHSYEIISVLINKYSHVYLFACLDQDAEITKKLKVPEIDIIKIFSIPFRISRELSFLFFLLLKLFFCARKIRPDVIYIRHGSLSLVGCIIGKLLKIPVCLEVNDILIKRNEFKSVHFFKKIWINQYEKFSFPLASAIFPVTDRIKAWICKEYFVAEDRISTVSNGVNTSRFQPSNMDFCRSKFKLPKDAFIVGYLGSLFHWAGIEYLVEAAHSIILACPSVLFIIGGGEEPYFTQLRDKVRHMNLSSNFKFFGEIRWDEASDFINTFDIAIAPAFFNNLDSGISSQKVLAYLACGKAVVGSDVPGLGDFLELNDIGISFKMGNSKELSQAVIKMFNNKDRNTKMGKKGRDYVAKYCSWDVIVDRLLTNFNELIERNKI